MALAPDLAVGVPTAGKRGQVLIADGSALRASATARLVESFGHRVVGTVTRPRELLRDLHATWPDLVVMGFGHLADEWLQALQELRDAAPQTPVIAWGGHERRVAMAAIRTGVSDFFIGMLDPERFAEALERASYGRLHVRIDRELLVTCSVPGSSDVRRWFTGRTRDLGAAGVSFWTTRLLSPQQVVNATVALPGGMALTGQLLVLSTVEEATGGNRGHVVRAIWRQLDQPEVLHEFLARELAADAPGPAPIAAPPVAPATPTPAAPMPAAAAPPVAPATPTPAALSVAAPAEPPGNGRELAAAKIAVQRRGPTTADIVQAAQQRFQEPTSRGVLGQLRTTATGHLIAANDAAATMFGYDSPEAMVRGVELAPDLFADLPDRGIVFRQLATIGEVRGVEVRGRRADGGDLWVEIHAFASRNALGTLNGVEVMLVDVTERRRARRRLAAAADVLGMVARGAPLDATLTELTHVVEELLPGSSAKVAVSDLTNIDAANPDAAVTGGADGAADGRQPWRRELRDGVADTVLGSLIVRPGRPEVLDPPEDDERLLDLAADLASVAVRRALGAPGRPDGDDTDPVTGLAGARSVHELLDASEGSGTGSVSLLLVEVDGTHPIDGAAGSPDGHALVGKVARHLVRVLDGRGHLARMGGLTFAVLDQHGGDPSDAGPAAEELARRIVRSFAMPFTVSGGAVYLSTRVGVATSGAAETSRELLGEAATALAHTASDASGVGRVVAYAPALRHEALAHARAVAGLSDAVATGDLTLLVEPVMGLIDGRLEMVRAATSWHHPEHGAVGPDGYQQLAEDCGLSVPIWAMTLRTACGLLHRWVHEGASATPVVVELTPRVIAEPGCVAEVVAALAQWPVDPTRIVLELTDAAAVAEAPASRRVVHELRDLGVTIAARGFGGRRAPATAVRALPVTIVTLDPVLTRGLDDPAAMTVLTSLVHLARSLRLTTVAVDVASPVHANELRSIGIGAATGPAWASPLALTDFDDWAAAHGVR
jgi:PAS domain S-box-containing protein